MSRGSPVLIEEVTLFLITDKAILIGEDGADRDDQIWIPISQILDTDLDYESDESLYSEGYVEIPGWLAEKKVEDGADWMEKFI